MEMEKHDRGTIIAFAVLVVGVAVATAILLLSPWD